MKRLYLRRNGEIIECGDDFEIVNDRGHDNALHKAPCRCGEAQCY